MSALAHSDVVERGHGLPASYSAALVAGQQIVWLEQRLNEAIDEINELRTEVDVLHRRSLYGKRG